MRRVLCSLFLVVVISGIYSCNSEGDKKTGEPSTTETPVSDTAIPVAPPETTTTPAANPAPTEEIPVDDARYDTRTNNIATSEIVRNALTKNIFKNDLSTIEASQRKFIMYEIDLNGDTNKEIFVGFKGSYFCGTGGCSAYLLKSDGSIITNFTVTEYPIIIGPMATKGWLDLTIISGGAEPTLHQIKWDGTNYPGNPSVQPKITVKPPNDMPRALDWRKTPYPLFSF